MATANKAPIYQLGRERVPVFGSFAPDTANPIAATSRKGLGWSVVYTGVGTYTVTFTEKWVDLESAVATLQLAAAGDQFAQVGTFTASTSTTPATLVIRVLDASGAAVAEVAANANNRVNFCCWFLDTKTGPRRG